MTSRERKYLENKKKVKRNAICFRCGCDFKDEYYGIRCKRCGVFYPHGGEPWNDNVFFGDPYDDGDRFLHSDCPNCHNEYDEIDLEYQICHICGFNAQ